MDSFRIQKISILNHVHISPYFLVIHMLWEKKLPSWQQVILKHFLLGKEIPTGLYKKKCKILSIYTILHTQTYYQSFKTDLKAPGNLISWKLKNRIIFGKCAFFLRILYVHRYIGLIRHVIMFIVHVLHMVAVHKDTL
jgi:hypothetical protein